MSQSRNFVYTSSNTDLQTIDTFDLPLDYTIRYQIQIASNNDIQMVTVDVVHDGVDIGSAEHGVALAYRTDRWPQGLPKLVDVLTDINTANTKNYTGILTTTPVDAITSYTIEKTVLSTNSYSENTISGRELKLFHGMSASYEEGVHSATVNMPYAGDRMYGNPDELITIYGMQGTAVQNPELLVNGDFHDLSGWKSHAGNLLIVANNFGITQSSGQMDNFQYQEVDVVPGTIYMFSGIATNSPFIDPCDCPPQTWQSDFKSVDACRVKVGDGLNSSLYGQYVMGNDTNSDAEFSFVFEAKTNKAFVAFGYGAYQGRSINSNYSLKEAVPYPGYGQKEGTIYLKWQAITPNTTNTALYTYTSLDNRTRVLLIDPVGNIILNEDKVSIACGTQTANAINKIAVSYSQDDKDITTVLNGGSPNTTPNVDVLTQMTNITMGIQPLKFVSFNSRIANNLAEFITSV